MVPQALSDGRDTLAREGDCVREGPGEGSGDDRCSVSTRGTVIWWCRLDRDLFARDGGMDTDRASEDDCGDLRDDDEENGDDEVFVASSSLGQSAEMPFPSNTGSSGHDPRVSTSLISSIERR